MGGSTQNDLSWGIWGGGVDRSWHNIVKYIEIQYNRFTQMFWCLFIFIYTSHSLKWKSFPYSIQISRVDWFLWWFSQQLYVKWAGRSCSVDRLSRQVRQELFSYNRESYKFDQVWMHYDCSLFCIEGICKPIVHTFSGPAPGTWDVETGDAGAMCQIWPAQSYKMHANTVKYLIMPQTCKPCRKVLRGPRTPQILNSTSIKQVQSI